MTLGYGNKVMTYYDDYLEHHGILGQKWGVRRYQNADGSLTAAGKAKNQSKNQTVDPNKGVKITKAKDGSTYYTNTKDHKHSHGKTTTVSDKGDRKTVLGATLAMYGGTAAQVAVAATTGLVVPTGLASTTIGAIAGTGALIAGDVSAHKANKKEKEFLKERENEPIDKKTGFHKKDKTYTLEEDIERVNPAYGNWAFNTKNNCALCTMSLELRLRGYDVSAKKTDNGYSEADERDFFKNVKTKQLAGSKTDKDILSDALSGKLPYITPENQKKMINATVDEMKKNKDSRGNLGITWNGTTFGHSVMYMNDKGTIKIIDAQSNETYTGEKAVKDYLKKTSQVSMTRLDNAEIDYRYIKEVAA